MESVVIGDFVLKKKKKAPKTCNTGLHFDIFRLIFLETWSDDRDIWSVVWY